MDKVWLYRKLFHDPGEGGQETDRLLLRYAGPAAEALLARGWADRFFFLRYGKDGHHLRFRIRLSGAADVPAAVEFLRAAEQEAGVALRVEEAEYEPETDKYGGAEGVELAERQFHRSSLLALSCIGRTVERRATRVLVATYAFETLLTLAGFDAPSRLTLAQAYADYWNSFFVDASGRRLPRAAAGGELTQLVRDCLSRPDEASAVMCELAGPDFSIWRETLRRDLLELDALVERGLLQTPREVFIFNLAHTLNNRLGLSLPDEIMISDLVKALGERGAMGP